MSRFLQLHLLTFFPPANLNRDDTGRPKTAVVGGAPRLRLSSQALKRAWRTSEVFEKAPDGHLGVRTQRIGENIALLLQRDHQLGQAEASSIARVLAAVFGKPESSPKPGQELFIRQLAFISPDERGNVSKYLERAMNDPETRAQLAKAASEIALDPEGDDEESDNEVRSKKGKAPKQSKQTTKLIKEMRAEILTVADTAADIALFGRMLADTPDRNREAAAQVAHAITTHRVTVEDDYYTAVDDLKTPAEDAGAGFLGEAAFGSGIFYLYLCIDRALLLRNLGGETALAATALGALAEAAATVAPRGKQNSFAAHGRADYVLAEKGDQQPRTLAGAFARPIAGSDLMADSVKALTAFRAALTQAYGPQSDAEKVMHVGHAGTLADIIAFCRA
ncbi:type I-E CRISPR-associated protein Cas7/Cse4/CasC [Siccirubricoccus phaeus]|uniref:type I-E CRISPR-associated protein Cas7/Cse4/CasC n=1 Tax=Siccirubricoccus phaeus TaxID=2595053 RepID=UPI0011F116D0|nr:type I-E CRISPR-associated protein Cas7/Cse4/CasC [Siccirubricoccus phaeus]